MYFNPCAQALNEVGYMPWLCEDCRAKDGATAPGVQFSVLVLGHTYRLFDDAGDSGRRYESTQRPQGCHPLQNPPAGKGTVFPRLSTLKPPG
jgi:hypothetical protein